MATQVSASFSLTGTFDPAEITRTLGMVPSRTWRAGDKVGRRAVVRKDDGWVVEVPREDSLDVAGQVDKLLAVLQPRLTELYLVTAKYRLISIVSCAVYVEAQDGTSPAMCFSKETIAKLGEMGASLDVDLYVL